MATLEEVKKQICSIGYNDQELERIWQRSEINELPKILQDDEVVEFVKATFIDSNPNPLGLCLLVITNKRFFVADKKLFGFKVFDFFYGKINTIESNISLGRVFYRGSHV